MTKAEEIAQWVIDNRYAKSELEKVSDFEMFHKVKSAMEEYREQRWVKWAEIPETFAEYHIRYSLGGFKLDTDLFELRDGALYKRGGGTIPLHAKDIEYLT